MARVTAKREARQSGLIGIGQGPRGYCININGEEVATIFAQRKGFEFEWIGWKILLFASQKTERRILVPKGQLAWPMTDEGLEQAKKAALDLVKKIYL